MALQSRRFRPAFLTCCRPARCAWRAGPNGAQERGAEAFIDAVASGNAQAIAQELHPDELEKLRARLLTLLRAEASRSDNTYRSRLFGPGRSLAELESMTAVRFYAALSDRLRLRARAVPEVRLAGRRAGRTSGLPPRAWARRPRSAAR